MATAGSPVAYTAYAVNFGGHTITPINTATNATSATIAINDPSAVAITPNGQTALVANWGEHTVTPVTLSNGTVGTPINVGNQPYAIAITPNGSEAYVADYNANGPGTVTPINLTTDTAGTNIVVGKGPDAIVITPDGTMAYVANHFDGTVTPITIASNTAGTPITVGAGANVAQTDALAITPNGSTVYAADYGSNSVVPITVASNTAGAAITGITSPMAMAITPDGSTAWIAEDGNPGNVVPMTLANDTLGAAITVGRNPYNIAITPDQATAYVANYNANGAGSTVTPINLSTDTAGTNIAVGNGPEGIAITPDQAPVATFTATAAPTGSASSFDATASSVLYGTITNYQWNFGDGTTTNTATPTTTHTYTSPGVFTATLTETDTAGTSTTQVFNGQTMSLNGRATAQTTQSLTINAAPQITTQPSAATATAPNQASFTTACSGSPAPTVQWQLSTDTGVTWNNISGATSTTLNTAATSAALNGYQYRAICTNTISSATSNPATLTVNTTPQVLTQPTAVTVTAPNQASFTTACSGSPAPSIQWQLSTDTGSTWTNLASQTAATLTIPTTSTTLNGNQYRATCTNVAGSSASSPATLTVAAAPAGATSTAVTPPVLGVDFVAQPHGIILARLTRGGPLVQLSGPTDIPLGTLIDARSGTVALNLAMPAGHTQPVSIGRGSFTITQPRSQHGLTHIGLAGGNFAACPAAGKTHRAAAHTATAKAKPGHVVRQLWSKDNHGKFQTYGHNSVATVRGTEWVTQDRCDGTLTHVIQGVVAVHPRGTHKTILITAGHSYLAK